MSKSKRILVSLVALISLLILAVRSEAEIVIGDQIDIYVAPNEQARYGKFVAYDSVNRRFLVVWDDYGPLGANVAAQLVNDDGTLYGGPIVLAEDLHSWCPYVAFDPLEHRFLVVWANNDNPARCPHALGQLINSDGSFFGDTFDITPYSPDGVTTYSNSVAFDNTLNRFFVLLVKYGGGQGTNLYGQFVNPDGSLSGELFPITNFSGPTWAGGLPFLGYDLNNSRFLVVYQHSDSWNIYGAILNADGTFYSQEFIISTLSGGAWPENPPPFDSVNSRFLVTWSVLGDIHGQLVNTDGTLFGGEIIINLEPETPALGSSTIFDSANNKFLLIGYNSLLRGQLLNLDGSLFGTYFDVPVVASFGPFSPFLVFGSADKGSLMVWPGTAGVDTDVMGKFIKYVNNPPVLNPIGDKKAAVPEGSLILPSDLLTFTVTGSDPDSDQLYITSANLPSGATLIDHGDGSATFSWLPNKYQKGSHSVTFQISDSEINDEEVVNILVTRKRATTELIGKYQGKIETSQNIKFLPSDKLRSK